MPAKFHKKLWVKRGGYLVVEHSAEAAADAGSRVTGTIKNVLYDEHIRQLKKTPGAW
jgi:probable RNA-binding protein EIF1AD